MNPDPFLPRAIGDGGLAALWPDTRFVELSPGRDRLASLLGIAPQDVPAHGADWRAVGALWSVIVHETAHWRLSHARSWPLMRTLATLLRGGLGALFLHEAEEDRRAALSARTPALRRDRRHGPILPEDWRPTLHTAAEHAWICTALPRLVDDGMTLFASSRTPERLPPNRPLAAPYGQARASGSTGPLRSADRHADAGVGRPCSNARRSAAAFRGRDRLQRARCSPGRRSARRPACRASLRRKVDA